MKRPKKMPTPEQTYFAKAKELRNRWAEESNATQDQQELFQLCEQFIADNDAALDQAGGHPEPPPPRIRP